MFECGEKRLTLIDLRTLICAEAKINFSKWEMIWAALNARMPSAVSTPFQSLFPLNTSMGSKDAADT